MIPWKRTFYAAWLGQIVSITGFMFVFPFLPFYIRELGVTGDASVARWTGIVSAGAPITMALFAPFWGHLADQYGRKLMVVRAMLSGTVVLLLMAMARNVTDLFICRLLQGALTGTITANTALVASITPPGRAGYTLGMMQAAVFLGVSVGPLMGGICADALGYRACFYVAAAVLFVGGFLVIFAVNEPVIASTGPARCRNGSFVEVLTGAGFLAAVFTLLTIRFANSAANPIFPLFVEKIRGPGEGIATLTGSIISVAGIAAAVFAGIFGRVGDSRGHKPLLVGCSILAAFASFLHALATSVLHLFILRTLFGLAVAGMLPAANAIIRDTTHDRNIGKAYGLTTALTAIGWAAGPLTGGYLAAALGLRAPFVLTTLVLLLAAGVAGAFIRSSQPAPPSADDEGPEPELVLRESPPSLQDDVD